MKNFKNKANLLLALLLVATMAVGSLAYFTDRVQHNASYETADASKIIDVTTEPGVDPDDPSKPDPDPDYDPEEGLKNQWESNNPDAFDDPFVPGDKADLGYQLTNLGDPIDVRQTFILTSTVDMDVADPANRNPEFRLFDAATDAGYGAFEGVNVIAQEVFFDGNLRQVKYEIAPFTMETNEIKELDYVLVFDRYASNDFQGAKCTVDYLVEMRQHVNGVDAGSYNSAGWTDIMTENITFGGSNTYKAVPAA